MSTAPAHRFGPLVAILRLMSESVHYYARRHELADAADAIVTLALECNRLREALQELEAASIDAVHALNDRGEPAPARLGLAAERARALLGGSTR